MTTLPEKQPYHTKAVDYERAKAIWGAKLLPRQPKDGETLYRIDRPQRSPTGYGGADRGYVEYIRGDMIGDTVIVVTGRPFRGRIQGCDGVSQLQYAVCRPATDADRAAVADAKARQAAEGRAVMDSAMMINTSWFVERRLDYIDALLAERGSIRRGDLVAAFGNSIPQASLDLAAFMRLYPGALRYDGRAKQYVAAATPYARCRRLSNDDRETLALLIGGVL